MIRTLALTLSVLFAVMCGGLFAEEDPEAAQAAREQALEDEKGAENFQILFEGKLFLGGAGEGTKDVVGIFRCEKRAYQLKLAQPDLLPKLKPHNGKTVTLKGRPRVNGKYFVAQGLHETVPNPVVPHRRPRGGGL